MNMDTFALLARAIHQVQTQVIEGAIEAETVTRMLRQLAGIEPAIRLVQRKVTYMVRPYANPLAELRETLPLVRNAHEVAWEHYGETATDLGGEEEIRMHLASMVARCSAKEAHQELNRQFYAPAYPRELLGLARKSPQELGIPYRTRIYCLGIVGTWANGVQEIAYLVAERDFWQMETVARTADMPLLLTSDCQILVHASSTVDAEEVE